MSIEAVKNAEEIVMATDAELAIAERKAQRLAH